MLGPVASVIAEHAPAASSPVKPPSQADVSVSGVVDRCVVAGEAPWAGLVTREGLRVRGTTSGYCANGGASDTLTVRGWVPTERAGLCDLRQVSHHKTHSNASLAKS